MNPELDCNGPDCVRTTRLASGLCLSHDAQRRRGAVLTPLRVRRPVGANVKRDGRGRKHCVHCDMWKPEDAYTPHRGTADSLSSWCRHCTWLAKYGLDPERYAALLIQQSGRCASCGQAPGRGNGLVVDHDHACCDREGSCGRCVRGLLCDACNKILGLARDDIAVLRNAVKYLQQRL